MSKIELTSHADVTFEPNKKLGYYLLGNRVYYNKLQALLDEARQTEHYVKWFFNEDKFITANWTVEPEETINELYRQRAQQLRDTYDWIRVEVSGGADSTTAIFAFLLNGIHLDEVIFRYPKSGEKNVVTGALDISCENTLSEWEYAAKPLFDWIATHYPRTKITFHDYSENLLADSDTRDESWIFRTRHFLQPGHYAKHNNLLDEHKRIADQGLSICVLYGTDKPKVCIKDGKFWMYFVDAPTGENDPYFGQYTNMSNEYFYWAPESTKILTKQAHLIKQWVELPMNHKMQNLLRWPNNSFATRTMYEQFVKHIIYPDYDSTTFQVVKSTNNIYNEMDHWFHSNFKGTRLYDTWEAGINYLVTNINERHVGHRLGKPTDLTVFQSPFYYIGDCNIPQVGPLSNPRPGTTAEYKHVIGGKLSIY
jgi:hypothetical protein